ncbi:DUF3592 domain-containing protein [Prosthecobacter sp.]|uniref:DUF3592 domain-containing protein n=1 Tax=Prosthecobacter sp. TaxID=1965333 RepID=UPI0037850F5A
METPTKIKIVAAIGILAGPFLAYNGHQEKERLARLEKDGITVEGLLGDGESRRSGKRSRSYTFDAVFTPQGASTPVKKSYKVSSSFFSSHTNETTVTNPQIQVRYLPDNPHDSAVIVGGSTDDAALFPVGIGAFALGLCTLGVMTLRKS